MPKISVIMPSLNVAEYIQECMESVLAQTLKDIEIICVDAGSTDGTIERLQEYEIRDRRVHLILSEKKSYGYQMNLGMKAAKGEYIGIVETDDFIVPEMYEELYNTAQQYDADFVKSDFDLFATLEDGERVYLRYFSDKYTCARYNRLFSSEDYIASKDTLDVFIWNGIYKRAFLEDHQILFQETPGAAFQDCGFRYQVALNVKRGVFLNRSLYRYRRDNAGSSTYNKKCVLFNLSECRNLLRTAQAMEITDRKTWEFLAREISIIAHRPYVELLEWNQPAEGTKEALEEFRGILREFIDHGLLSQDLLAPGMWMQIRIFVDNPEFYEYYSRLEAEIVVKQIRKFLERLSSRKQVILFGSGFVGQCAYCLIRLNKISNIVAFADNDRRKWGQSYGGCPIESPEKLRKDYPNAYYLIANSRYSKEIREQLLEVGIDEEHIGMYDQTTFPVACTNIFMGTGSDSEE